MTSRIVSGFAAALAAAALAACGGDQEPAADAEAEAEAGTEAAEAEADQAAGQAAAEAPAIDFETSDDPGERAAAEASNFLDRNAERDEVTVTSSGMQYEVVASGPAAGRSPEPGDWTCVHYTGALVDGTVFDTSRSGDGAEPLLLPLTGMIEGWREALSLMAAGDHWIIYVPSELAYGRSGAQDASGQMLIPPNAAVVFDVELLGVYRTDELPLTPERRLDPAWNCAEPPDAVSEDGAAAEGED